MENSGPLHSMQPLGPLTRGHCTWKTCNASCKERAHMPSEWQCHTPFCSPACPVSALPHAQRSLQASLGYNRITLLWHSERPLQPLPVSHTPSLHLPGMRCQLKRALARASAGGSAQRPFSAPHAQSDLTSPRPTCASLRLRSAGVWE